MILAMARRCRTSRIVTPNRLAISSASAPSFTSAAKALYWSISSIGSRAMFSASEASMARASSPSCMTMQGTGSTPPSSGSFSKAR